MQTEKIILLCRNTTSSLIVYNYLSQYFDIDKVIIEDAPSKWFIIKKRIDKLGWLKVCGQILFQVIVHKTLTIKSKKRIAEILNKNGLSINPIPKSKIIKVTSVNADGTIKVLKATDEGIIIVSGTRIITKRVLDVPNKIFINMHAGITPAYRGVHGAYWAYRNKEPFLAGVTIHYVDKGIDTGQVISQKIIEKNNNDNFVTYPYLQLTKGLPELKKNIHEVSSGNYIKNEPLTNKSKLYSHPTIFEYLYSYFFQGVK